LVSAGPVDWKRNLTALWLAEFVAIFGFSFAFPFLPLYLHQDLAVRTTHDLALWTGVIGGASGLSMTIASPVWGVLADRYGRKPMLVRAMLGGAITVGLMSIAQAAPQLLALRTVQGATSGTVPAATALAAAETPRSRVAWSMGVLSSAVALGGATAPLIGGLAAVVFGLRAVFLGAGVLLALSSLPVLLVVRESPRPRPKKDDPPHPDPPPPGGRELKEDDPPHPDPPPPRGRELKVSPTPPGARCTADRWPP
jgi:DHA1 family multidrug resistance protein-like MFS transporter